MSQTPGTIVLRCLVVFLAILLSFALADRTPGLFTRKYTASAIMQVRQIDSPDFGLSPRSPNALVQRLFNREVLEPAIANQGHAGSDVERELGKLRSAIMIKEIRGTELVTVSASAESPTEAARLANAITENLRQALITTQREEVKLTLTKLREELARQREKVDTLRAAANRIRAGASIIDLDPDHEQKSQNLDEVVAQLQSDINSLQATQEKLASLSDEDVLKEIIDATDFGKSLDPTMSEIAEVLRSIKAKSSTFEPNTPQASAAESRIQKLDAQLRELLPILRNRIESNLLSKKRLLQTTSVLRAAKFQADPAQAERCRKAKEEYLREKDLLEKAETKLQTEEMAISSPLSICTIWERAEPPPRPSNQPALILALVFLIGLLAGAALAFAPKPGIVALVLFVLIVIASFPRWSHLLPSGFFSATAPPVTGFVDVAGGVKTPQRVEYAQGLTMESAVWRAGGFTEDAKKVSLLRSGTVSIYNVKSLQRNPLRNIPVEPGDRIFVPQTLW